MSYPTMLGPWFVVQQLRAVPSGDPLVDGAYQMEYYTAMGENVKTFQPNKKLAMLFMSLASAARVASAEGAEVRVLTSKEEAEEFGR